MHKGIHNHGVSIKTKVAVIMILFTILLSTGTIIVSYFTYTTSFNTHYESLATSITKTVASVLNTQDVATVTQEVKKVYHDICSENDGNINLDSFGESEKEAYYARFEYIQEMTEYNSLLEQLTKIKENNDVVSLYVGYTDNETMKDLYVVDASEEGQARMLGDMEEAEKEDVDKLLSGDYSSSANIKNYKDYGWLCSASTPVTNENEKVICLVYVDISMNRMYRIRQAFLTQIAVFIAIIAVVMLAVILLITDKTILKPIVKLSYAADSYIENQKDEKKDQLVFGSLKINTRDEIETLYNSLKQMESNIGTYIKEVTSITAEKERIGAELDVATHIQKSMLPCIFPAFPDKKEFDIYATMNPAKEVGGDFYDFFMVDDRHLAIVMADVSGKGVPAALFMVIGKTLIKDHTQAGKDLGETFTSVNRMLCEANSEGLFITAFEGILDIVTGEFTYVNAGHELPFVIKAGKGAEPYKIRAGFVLAGMEEMHYKSGKMILEPGDKIFQYTDGITEATNAQNELYGMDRLSRTLNLVKDKKPEEIISAVKADIDAFVKDAPQFDDITMLCLEYKERMICDERTDN